MLRAKSVFEELKACGVTHVIGLADKKPPPIHSCVIGIKLISELLRRPSSVPPTLDAQLS